MTIVTPCVGGLSRGPRKVLHIHRAVRAAKQPRFDQSSHHVQVFVAEHGRILQCALDTRLEFLLASGQRGKTTLAFSPIARRSIEERLRQSVGVEP